MLKNIFMKKHDCKQKVKVKTRQIMWVIFSVHRSLEFLEKRVYHSFISKNSTKLFCLEEELNAVILLFFSLCSKIPLKLLLIHKNRKGMSWNNHLFLTLPYPYFTL